MVKLVDFIFFCQFCLPEYGVSLCRFLITIRIIIMPFFYFILFISCYNENNLKVTLAKVTFN